MSFEISMGRRKWGWLKILRNVLGIATIAFLSCKGLDAQEQRHLRHILIASEPVADRLIEVIEEGRDFKALARKYSLDVGTKLLGGDLDWVSYGAMEPQFSAAAFAIENPLGLTKCKTRYGWHVIQLIETRGTPLPKPPAPDVGKPAESQEKPVSRIPVDGDRNDDLKWTVRFKERSVAPGDPVELIVGVRNVSKTPLSVLDPVLWPMGLIVRYQFGKLNVPVAMPEGFDASTLEMRVLGGQEYLERSFVLNDYSPVTTSWPIIRVIWRGDSLFGRIEKTVPSVVDQPEYASWKSRWRFYRSDEAQFNVLPEVKPEDRWFLCLFSNGRIWIELEDVGIPGLRSEIIRQVREGKLNETTMTMILGQSIQFGVTGPTDGGVRYDNSMMGGSIERGTFMVRPKGSKDGVMLGHNFAIGLGPTPGLQSRSIPCGKLILEEGQPINRIQERINKGLGAELTLSLAYPLDLLPEKVRASMNPQEKDDASKQKQTASQEKPKLEGVSSTTPSSANQKPALTGQNGKTPPRPRKEPLPRVLLDTTAGVLLVELFEDDSPNTVKNFISLVESGFYDGLKFHRKANNPQNRGFIQGGSPDGTSSGGPGYRIADEVNGKNRANRGALIMARKHSVPNTAGSQFLIGLDNLAYLDGLYTVFGRVVGGDEFLDRLQEGSVIRRAVVKSKRDHDYTPAKILTIGQETQGQ